MTDTPMTPDAALTRLRQYGERTSAWSTATYNDGTEKALHEIALTLAAEVQQWRATFGEQALPGALAQMQRLRTRVAELESATGTARAMHRKHPDSEHCQYDGMTWPCPSVTALGDADEADDLAEGLAGLEAMRADHPAPCRVPDSPDCTCPKDNR
ncbi:hypothetical protein [Streptomyces sp. NPDC059783]|uniref:hypothetical protein n=1 Tax=Streptomyces sp. NPDC059783 TaxID=3346944 RepID=UPI00365D6756